MPDNIFRNDSGDDEEAANGTDSWLTIISQMFVFEGNATLTLEWDLQ